MSAPTAGIIGLNQKSQGWRCEGTLPQGTNGRNDADHRNRALQGWLPPFGCGCTEYRAQPLRSASRSAPHQPYAQHVTPRWTRGRV